MMIEFIKPHTDGFGKTYLRGWVAEWAQPDAERAIEEGFARRAPAGAFARKAPAPVFECAAAPQGAPLEPPFTATGEEIALPPKKKFFK